MYEVRRIVKKRLEESKDPTYIFGRLNPKRPPTYKFVSVESGPLKLPEEARGPSGERYGFTGPDFHQPLVPAYNFSDLPDDWRWDSGMIEDAPDEDRGDLEKGRFDQLPSDAQLLNEKTGEVIEAHPPGTPTNDYSSDENDGIFHLKHKTRDGDTHADALVPVNPQEWPISFTEDPTVGLHMVAMAQMSKLVHGWRHRQANKMLYDHEDD